METILDRGDNTSIIDRGAITFIIDRADNVSIIDRGVNTFITDCGANSSIIDRGVNTSSSSIWAQLKPHLRGCYEGVPEVIVCAGATGSCINRK